MRTPGATSILAVLSLVAGCAEDGARVTPTPEGPMLEVGPDDLDLKASRDRLAAMPKLRETGRCTVYDRDGDANRPLFTIGVDRVSIYDGTRSYLWSAALAVQSSPRCAVEARRDAPVQNVEMAGVRTTMIARFRIRYQCDRAGGESTLGVRSDGRLVATEPDACWDDEETVVP